MTATPSHVDAIADARAALTPEQIAAKTAALQAKVDARIAHWEQGQQAEDDLDASIATETGLLSTAQAQLVTDTAQQQAKTQSVANLNAGIIDLQAQIAAAGTVDPLLVAERDEVVALLAELGITP